MTTIIQRRALAEIIPARRPNKLLQTVSDRILTICDQRGDSRGGCDTLGVNIIASGSVITAPSCQTKTRRKKWLISTFSSLGCYFWQTLPNVAIFRVRWFLLEKCDYILYNIYFNVFYSPNVSILWSLLIFVNL